MLGSPSVVPFLMLIYKKDLLLLFVVQQMLTRFMECRRGKDSFGRIALRFGGHDWNFCTVILNKKIRHVRLLCIRGFYPAKML